MTYADLAVTVVVLSIGFIASVILSVLWKKAQQWFCEALDSSARNMKF
jgi:hypothetical protein